MNESSVPAPHTPAGGLDAGSGLISAATPVRSVGFRDEDTNGDSDGFAKYRLPPGTPRRQRGPSVRGTYVIMHERYRHARSGADEPAGDRIGGEVLPGLDAQARRRARQEPTDKCTSD